MSTFGAVRLVTMLGLDAVGRLLVAGIANLPASPFRGMLWGSAAAHLVYVPVAGDGMLLARTTSGTDQPIAPVVDPTATIAVLGFTNGDIGLRTSAGALVRLSGANVYLTPGSGGKIILNGGAANAIGAGAHVTVNGSISSFGSFTATGTVDGTGNPGVVV